MGGQRRGCHVRRHAFALTQSSLDISRGGPARASVIKIFFKNRSGGSAQKIDDAFWGSNGARAHSAEPLSKMLRAMLQEPTSCIERAPMLCLSVCARGLGNVEGCFSPVAKIPISFAPWCWGSSPGQDVKKMLLMLTSPFTVEAPFTPVTDYREWTTHGAPLVARFTNNVLEVLGGVLSHQEP